MNGNLYCDVLQHKLKNSIARIPKKRKIFFQQGMVLRHTTEIAQEKLSKLKRDVLDWTSRSPG